MFSGYAAFVVQPEEGIDITVNTIKARSIAPTKLDS